MKKGILTTRRFYLLAEILAVETHSNYMGYKNSRNF
jgi:hypothetical protein